MKFKNWLRRGVLLSSSVCAVVLVHCGETASSIGTETHWFQECDAESDCNNLACVCGICTLLCSEDSDCSQASEIAECTAPADPGACSGGEVMHCRPASLSSERSDGFAGADDGSSGGDSPTGTSTSDGGTGNSCSASCDTPAGEVHPFESVEEVYAAMEGRWQVCPGSGTTFAAAPADMIGIEYGPTTPDEGGKMYYLVQGVDGPVRGQGFDYQLTYDVSPLGDDFQLNMHAAPNSGFGGSFRYSPCPTMFEISGGSVSPGAEAILVPFDE